MVENLGGDSDEDEGKTPTISVVIDEDVPPTEPNAENDQSEITSTTVEEAPSLVLEDHDYTGARSAGRGDPGWHGGDYSESAEPFPVLEGLESYIGEDVDYYHQQQHLHYQRLQQHYGPTPPQRLKRLEFRRLHADQSGRVTSSAAVIHASGGGSGGGVYSVRAGIRQLHKETGGYGGAPIPVQARPIGAGPNTLPTVFNQRSGVTRTIRQSEYGSPMMRGPPAGVAYGRYSAGSPAHPRALISSSTSSAASNGSYQSMLAGDPSRAANDNAPAPLIVPSRGVKPIQRSRVGIPSRMPVNVTGQSPRKFYQVTTKGSAADYDHMHSYAKAASSNADYETYGGSAGGLQYAHERGKPLSLAKAGGGRGVTDDQSSTFIDVVAEEEAQNAKFFQRQSDAMGGGVLAKPRTSSFNELHDGQGQPQHATPVKHNASKEQILVVDSPQHLSQHDPLSVPQRYRSIDGSGVPQGLPQRHRLLSSQMTPSEYGANPCYAYTISPDNQEIFMSKQAQRPRGRPRGSRTISVGSHAGTALSRQQPHGGRPLHTAMYAHDVSGVLPYVSPTSGGGVSGEVCSSSGEVDASGAAEFHRHAAVSGEISSSQDHPHPHQPVPQQQKFVAHQTYMYQPQSGTGDFHRQQRHSQTSSAAVAPELTNLPSETPAGCVPPEFSHADAQILQHQQRLERQQQQLQAAQQQHHLGGQQPQYQSLEDLADLAQLSQQQQHFISAAGQRPIYADSEGRSIYTSQGEPIATNKLAPHSSYHPDGSNIEPCQPEQHQCLEALQQHANGKPMHQLDDGAVDAAKQPTVMHQQLMPLNHHSYHNQSRATHISHSDSQLTAYYGHVIDSGYSSHAALNHNMLPNYGAPQPYLMTGFGGDGVTQFQASSYPPDHQLHGVAGHKGLMMEKLKKQRKPRTPKDSEALAEKKREKKERKQKAEDEKTPRRPRKSKDTSELTPTLAGHSSEANSLTVADTSASGLGSMTAVFEASVEKSDKKRATTQRSARKLSAVVTGLTTADDTADSSSGDDADKDYGDYTTRCLCGMTHNDDFMIQCDKCDVWQHGVCMDVSAKHPPKNYFCEQCDPRMLKHTKQHAASIQIRVLARIQDNKRRAKSSKGDTPKSAIKNKLKFKPKRTGRSTQEKQASPKKSLSVKESVKPENQYSRGVRAFIVQQTTNFGDAHLLKAIKGQSALARQMFVANNVEGLVALLTDPDSTIPAGSAIIEYNGLFHMASESAAQCKSPSAKNTSSLRYCGFGEENAIIVDGSKFGSAARFARRSCKPNAVVRHVIHEGRLHLLLVSNEVVGFSQEITVPFDFDFTASPIPVSCACGSTDEQFGRENPTDCDIYKFNQALASLTSVASVAAKPAPSTASRSQSPAKAKKTNEESVSVNEKEMDGNRRRSARNAPERVESSTPESGRKTRCAATVADTSLSVKVEADEKSQKSSGISRDILLQKKAEEVRKTRSAAVTSKVEPGLEPTCAHDVAFQKIKELEQSPEPRKTRSVVKQETPKVKEQPASPEARETRSAIKQKADAMPLSSSKARTIFKEKEAKSPKAATSPAEVDKPKLSREDRKVQEAMAAFQRMEERQKQQQDKRKSTSSAVGVTEKHIKTEPDMVKRSSLRLFSTSSASSSTSSVANARSTRRVTVVEPKREKNEGTPVTSKASKRISSQHDKNDSPSKKRRLDEKQISHAEAAQLLTEMAFGIKAESEEDLKKDIHSKLRLAAEIALQHTPIKAQGNFSLASHLTVASRDDKSAAKRARELATVTKSPAPTSTSTRAAKSTSKELAVANAKPEPKVERLTPKERAAASKEVKTKITTIIKPKEEALVKEATPLSPAIERSSKRRVSENQKQIASTEFASQPSVKLSAAGTPVVAVTAAADSSVATAIATSSTADSSDVTTSAIVRGDGEVFKAAAGSPPKLSTPTKAVTPVIGGGSGVVLPSTIVTKSVKKLTLAEYKKRQSSSALSTPNANTRQLRSSLLKPQRGFMPSLKDVSATSSSLSSPPSGLIEPNLSPRSAMFAAIPVPSPPAASASSLRSLDAVVAPHVPSSSSQVGTPSIDELRRRIFGGKTKEDTTESSSRSAVVTPSSQPRMTLEERLKSQFGLGRGQPINAESGALHYGSTATVPPPPLPPRSMTTRARASPYDPYATSGGDPSTILVPPPPPPPSHSIHERR